MKTNTQSTSQRSNLLPILVRRAAGAAGTIHAMCPHQNVGQLLNRPTGKTAKGWGRDRAESNFY
jgi:hypothetical protein